MGASLPCSLLVILISVVGVISTTAPTLIVQGKHGIYHLDTSGKLLNYRNETLKSYQRNSMMNPHNGTICWVSVPEEYENTGVIRCAPVDDLENSWELPTPEDIQVQFTEAIEIDYVTGNIYLTISGKSYVCSADFKDCAKVTQISDSAYLLTAYDIPNRLMFQISAHDYSVKPSREWWQMHVMNLDGSDRRKLADNSTLRFPSALAVDSAQKRLYVLDTPDALWVDLNRFDYNGQRLNTVARLPRGYKVSRRRSLKVIDDSAFVMWRNHQNISRIDLNTGETTHIVQGNITDGVTEIILAKKDLRSVNVYSTDLQPVVENSCLRSRGGCGDICVPTVTNGQPTHTCFCPPGQALVDTGCFDREPAFIIVAQKEALYAIDVATGEAFSILSGLTDATKVDFLYKGKLDYILYWIDDGGLFRGSWRQKGTVDNIVSLKPTGGNSQVFDVAVDWNQRNVLWMERDNTAVEEDQWVLKVASMNGETSKTIVTGPWLDQSAMLVRTDGLHVTCQAKVNDTAREFRAWNMQGEIREGIIALGMNSFEIPYKIREIASDRSAVDDARFNRFFWVNPQNSSIEVGINEYFYISDRKTLLEHNTLKNHAGMDALQDQIFWVDPTSGVMMTANSKTGADIQPLRLSGPNVGDALTEVRSIKALHPRKHPPTRFGQYCNADKNGCSDICLKALQGSKRQGVCVCADGKTLGDDGKTCA